MSRVRTTNFDAIATSAPLDAQASIIRDGSGDHWEGKVPEYHAHWKAPPPPEGERPSGCEDLTGRKMGRLTVIRYHRRHPKKGSQWLVRCTCGDYEVRAAKAIRGNSYPDHCCQACDYLRHINFKYREAGVGRARQRSDEALLDRLANPTTCRDCKSPYTCAAEQRCAIRHRSEAA